MLHITTQSKEMQATSHSKNWLCVAGVNNGSPAMVSEEAQQMLHDATELDYLTHIIIRMYENKR